MVLEEDKYVVRAAVTKARKHGIPWHRIMEAQASGSIPLSILDLIDQWKEEGKFSEFMLLKKNLRMSSDRNSKKLLSAIERGDYLDNDVRNAISKMRSTLN